MLTVEQMIMVMKFKESLGIPLEGCPTPRCPRDDELPPSYWDEYNRRLGLPKAEKNTSGPSVDMSTFKEFFDPRTGELLVAQCDGVEDDEYYYAAYSEIKTRRIYNERIPKNRP